MCIAISMFIITLILSTFIARKLSLILTVTIFNIRYYETFTQVLFVLVNIFSFTQV